MESFKVDDRCLTGKHLILRRDILNLLPKELRKDVEAIHVYVLKNQVQWVIFLNEDIGTYCYVPFSREVIYHPYGREENYEPICFWRKVRYLRDTYEHKGTQKKVYTTFVCRPNHMFLLREDKEYWFDDGEGEGSCCKTKWFRAFP